MLFEKIKNADLILTLQFIHNKSWQGKRVLISIFPGGSDDKESICNAGDWGSIPGLEDSPGEGNGYPLQYSCLENSWTKEQGGLQSVGLQRVGHNWETIMNNHQPKKKKKRIDFRDRIIVWNNRKHYTLPWRRDIQILIEIHLGW